MVNYKDLIDGTKEITPHAHYNLKRPYNPPLELHVQERERNLHYNYYAGVRLMVFYGKVWPDRSISTKNPSYTRPPYYTVEIAFKNVTEETGLSDIEIQQGNVPPRPSLSQNDMLVRCKCENYRFRADWANRKHNASIGSRFPAYNNRKTGRHWNDDTPMMCKHGIAFVKWLLKHHFITK